MLFDVAGVPVKFNWINDATGAEAKSYVDFVNQHKPADTEVKSIEISPSADENFVDLSYELQGEKIEHIQRTIDFTNWHKK